MLERAEEIPSDTFVGIEAHVYVQDYGGNTVLRATSQFATPQQAEDFWDQVYDHNPAKTVQQRLNQRHDALKYLIGVTDDFDRLELVEHTADGKRYRLKHVPESRGSLFLAR